MKVLSCLRKFSLVSDGMHLSTHTKAVRGRSRADSSGTTFANTQWSCPQTSSADASGTTFANAQGSCARTFPRRSIFNAFANAQWSYAQPLVALLVLVVQQGPPLIPQVSAGILQFWVKALLAPVTSPRTEPVDRHGG